jgi:hypothetical protein
MMDEVLNKLSALEKKIDKLMEIEIKNGGGRHIKYERTEFFQMLYDRGSFPKLTGRLYKLGLAVLLVLQIFQIVYK